MPPAPPPPRLHDQVALEFIATRGTSEVYVAGQVVERSPANDFQKQGIRFSRTGPGSWVMFGNIASDPIESYATTKTLVFTERSPIDAFLHVLTVYDDWHDDVRGFRAEYIRTLAAVVGRPRMIIRFDGYVRIP